MNETGGSRISELRIDPSAKRRSHGTLWLIFFGVLAIASAAVLLWRPWKAETSRVMGADGKSTERTAATPGAGSAGAQAHATNLTSSPSANGSGDELATPDRKVVLTVSGYIINRERIELSPRFMGQVRWIGVKKGDAVTNGQVVVLLDDAEYVARRHELQARLAAARVSVERAKLELARIERLTHEKIETQRALDLAKLDLAAAEAEVGALEGQIQLNQTYLDWTVIRAPINGVVLEKLVDPNELVTPQSFGGTRGPSTALISLGDPLDLQVEIDLNEADLSKVFLGQPCKVSPEAYLDRSYEGYVAEVAPEASRQKGTLQVKVQIREPDKFLTPELSAKVDFLTGTPERTTSSSVAGQK
jgi:HlyD family secretion protein